MRSSAKSTPDDTSNSLCRVVCVGVCDGTTPSQVIVYTKLCVSDRTAGKRRAIIRGQETCDNNMTGGVCVCIYMRVCVGVCAQVQASRDCRVRSGNIYKKFMCCRVSCH